jgi:nucleolar pre-ribosomal-associated protein 1
VSFLSSLPTFPLVLTKVFYYKLLKLYERITSDTQDADYVPADLVHHFLLAICTHPGVGICFKDRGWYPREAEGDSDLTGPKDDPDAANQKGGKMYNKILANILKTLKVNEDARQQELALKIMSACPELVAGYWAGAALTLEPRLSSKWITNVSFFGVIISLPVPTPCLFLPNTHQYNPTPPPLPTILENTLPSSINTKSHFSKGLQSPSGLVQHCTASALAKCLQKYEIVLRVFEEAHEALEEDPEEGQWVRRRKEMEREVRRRVPEMGVVVGFAQQGKGKGNEVRGALLAESAQRLLWMYHRCLPSVVAEARFDVGKLLLNFSVRSGDEKEDGMKVEGEEGNDGDEEPRAAVRLHRVQQLHVLKILKESDQFVWAGKAGTHSSPTLLTFLAHPN